MVWTAFEIAINCVQGLLILMFVKQCFAYEKQHPVADAALVLSCAGLLTFLLSRHMLFVDQLLYVFPAIYSLTLSSERKTSIHEQCSYQIYSKSFWQMPFLRVD